MSDTVQKKASHFCKTYGIRQVSKNQLLDILEKLGYTVVEFQNVCNDEAVCTLIEKLQLSDQIANSKGFTYVGDQYRFVFVNECLNEEEQMIVLTHELGHIYCKHFSHCNIIGNDVKEEYEANEFTHFVLNPSFIQKSQRLFCIYWKKILLLSCISFFILGSIFFWQRKEKEKTYYGTYYITEYGRKYHQQDCIFVKNKTTIHRMTKEEFASHKYEPCQICLPD